MTDFSNAARSRKSIVAFVLTRPPILSLLTSLRGLLTSAEYNWVLDNLHAHLE